MTELKFKSDIDVNLIQSMGGDHMVVAAARVSTEGNDCMQYANPDKSEENAGLINYLMKHRHGTPFEHSALTFYVYAPIFVWREWHRHRIGFCLSGDTNLDFEIPSFPGERRQRTIRQTLRSFQLPNKKSSVLNALLRCIDPITGAKKLTRITDIWSSGKKQLYELKTATGVIKSSADHRFLTNDGWRTLSELKGNVISIIKGTGIEPHHVVHGGPEEWRPWKDSRYEISNFGRVRSWAVAGSTKKCARSKHPAIKQPTANAQNRLVISIDKKVFQVSHLVFWAFHSNEWNGHILHRDGNAWNNHPDNLYCGTDVENARDRQIMGCGGFNRADEVPCSIKRIGKDETFDLSVEDDNHNFVADNIVTHNSYNEASGRYKQLDPVFYLPDRERPMMKVDGWKPGRPKFTRCENDNVYHDLILNLGESYRQSYQAYEDNLALGIDPGLARDCLPVGIYSGCWVTCNPRSLMAFLSLRTHEPEAAQVSYPLWEIEIAARTCEKILSDGWPITYKAFCNNGRVAP